jgi:hypothetical protein
MEKKEFKERKPRPKKVVPVALAPEDLSGEDLLTNLKASLEDIPGNLRTIEMWDARMNLFRTHYGHEPVNLLIASGYFDEWEKG